MYVQTHIRYYTCIYTLKIITSPPSEPDTIATSGVVLEQLQDIEFVVVVLEVGLVEHGVPKFTTFA